MTARDLAPLPEKSPTLARLHFLDRSRSARFWRRLSSIGEALRKRRHRPGERPITPAWITAAAARRGLAETAWQTGRSYLHGSGVPVNLGESLRWLRLAGRKGHPEAQCLLAELCLHGMAGAEGGEDASGARGLFAATGAAGPDYVGAEHWARLAAKGGSPEGQALLGHILSSGPDEMRNPDEAEVLFAQSAMTGCPQGMLGHALILARNVEDENAQRLMVEYVTEAAAAGLPTALYLLGKLHERGLGIRQDSGLAAHCYRRAAEKGSAPAQVLWGLALLQGRGVAADAAEGEAWLRRAAVAGEEAAWEILGNLVRSGSSAAIDPAVTCQWFERTAAAGNLAAAFYYGVCLAIGTGVDRNEFEAAYWLQRAAERLPKAQYWYGRLLVEGRGVARDVPRGRAWIARAALAGLPEARSALGELGPVAEAIDRQEVDLKLVAGSRSMSIASMNSATGDENVVPQTEICRCGSGLRPGRCCEVDPAYFASSEAVLQMKPVAEAAAAALERGDGRIARELALQALEVAPRLAPAIWTLCQIHRKSGQDTTACALLQRLVTLDPNNAGWAQELALLQFQSGELVMAEHHARNAVRLAPLDPRSHNLLGMILTESQRPHAGEFHYRRAAGLAAADDPILLANLAWNLKGQGRLAEARQLYRTSAAAAPHVFQTLFGWARLEEADRRLEAAQDLLDRAEKLRPDDPAMPLTRASILARQGRPGIALEGVENMLAKSGAGTAASAGIRADLLLQKGRLLDQLQRYDEAFTCFLDAKRAMCEADGKGYAEMQAADIAERMRRFFVKSHMRLMEPARLRAEIAQPIFILGFPRSGTTLAEQALSGHPNIAAGDELPFINEFIETAPRLLGSNLAYPEALAELWMGDNRFGAETLRDIYLQKAAGRGLTETGRAWFTDKMPLNEFHLGIISLLFPNSPLIHVIRHPLDVVLSAFSYVMTHGYSCSYSLQGLARHYVLVMDLVRHYRQELGLKYLELRYEDMIEDFEGGVRRMLQFIGEPFDERCVNFHQNTRLPHTPSYAQVSEKLYDRARFRYRKYMKHFEPVMPVLAPEIERLGYSVE